MATLQHPKHVDVEHCMPVAKVCKPLSTLFSCDWWLFLSNWRLTCSTSLSIVVFIPKRHKAAAHQYSRGGYLQQSCITALVFAGIFSSCRCQKQKASWLTHLLSCVYLRAQNTLLVFRGLNVLDLVQYNLFGSLLTSNPYRRTLIARFCKMLICVWGKKKPTHTYSWFSTVSREIA